MSSSGQIETEPIRVMVDMRQVASAGEQPQVWIYDPKIRRPVPLQDKRDLI
jgi:hypothetical protein